MNHQDFVHLHTHTHYSLLEALPSPKKLVRCAKEQGAKALAITDNGAMYGVVEFYKACQAEEIKPIIGLDAYIAPNRMADKRPRFDDKPYRLTLLALNNAGYKNLMKVSTAGFLEGFYYKPRVDKEYLSEHNEGLVALSGGVRGEIATLLSMGDKEKAKAVVEEYKSIFGPENYYLELIHHPDFPRQVEANSQIRDLAVETNTPLVVTKNSFYLDPDDREPYDAQLCIMRGRTLDEYRQTNAEDVDLSIGTPEEICKYFADVPEALENTKKIADRVDFEMDLGHDYLPIFPMPEGKNDNDFLHELALKGLHNRYGEVTPEMMERFDFEFETIKRMGYASYFIIVQDFVNFAKERGILVGPGRGSAAGSIISYALNVTDLDPLRYGLLFERFLNPDRISMPDIDMDFADNRRGEVLDYVTNKYGEDRVAGIITFGTMMPRAAVRDAARVLGLSYDEADLIAKTVPPPIQGRHMPLTKAIEEDVELKKLYSSNPMARRVIDLAIGIEGNPRHASQHACGIVIGDVPLIERVPLQKGQREDMALVTQYSLNNAEAVGLVKMDFLGLSNLTVIQDALEIIEAVHGEKIDIDKIPLEDKEAFALLGRAETTGVFQLESDGMKRYIRDLKPTQFEDIIAMVSLYRPGPMQFIESFIRRKHGTEKIEYEHPLMENAFRETYGIPVYQEQVMQVAKDMAGFSGGEADTLRKAMGKKIAELMAKMKVKFIDGAVANGVDKKIATAVFQKLEDFAAYGFNKSHAASYAMIAYRTAYLKAHYPPEFMAALMNSDINSIDRITIEVEECSRMGIKVLSPDVNESFPGFAVVPETGNVRWGLAAIKNFGEEVARAIVAERKENGEFKDLVDFASRIPSQYFNKKSLESLVKAGALDRFEDRAKLISNIDQLLLFNKQLHKEKEQNQVSMFDVAPGMSKSKLTLGKALPISKRELMAWEKELLGIYVSSHPAELFGNQLDNLVTPCRSVVKYEKDTPIKIAGVIADVKKILTKKKSEPMAFVRLEDTSGEVELVVFPRLYAGVKEMLAPGVLVVIDGKVSVRDREMSQEHSVLCDKILPFSEGDLPEVAAMLQDGIWFDDGFPESSPSSPFSPHDLGLSIAVPEKPTHDMIVKLREIFKANPGQEQVYLVVRSGDQDRKVATEYQISASQDVIDMIEEVVGQKVVVNNQ
ncbi:MAG: DNA polymerase III subunit alpha [bacterium]